LWRRRFWGDAGIIGRNLRLDAQLYTVIGVMPRGFKFPAATTQYWIPMQIALPAT
jgi:putative ABC transport system permease protein